ncbi:MAG: hypothetical protein OXN25_16165 [Candidatus Poribacteria bacterium]|nr:hypothetical protein [Candidatus Poribacteria bacterium]
MKKLLQRFDEKWQVKMYYTELKEKPSDLKGTTTEQKNDPIHV